MLFHVVHSKVRYAVIAVALIVTIGLLGLVVGTDLNNQAVNENTEEDLLPNSQLVQGEFLLKPFSKIPDSKIDKVLKRFGLAKKSDAPSELEELGIVMVTDTKKSPEKTRQTERDQNVKTGLVSTKHFAFVEQNRIVEPTQVSPDDPFYANWQRQFVQQQFDDAWVDEKGSADVIIAIVDTGVRKHEDLSSKLTKGTNIVSSGDGSTNITNDHGTLVAGVASAVTNNSLGVAGGCWNCKIMPVRITNSSDGWAYYSDMAAGIKYAADNGAKVANLSYIGMTSSTVRSAAKHMFDKGGIVTMAMGNDGSRLSTSNTKEIIAVGAVDAGNNIYYWSNSGPSIDVVASGGTHTTFGVKDYTGAGGTSIAAPFVAGLAGILYSAKDGISSDSVLSSILNSAVDLGSTGYDEIHGWGIIDAAAALALANGSSGGGGGGDDTTPPSITINTPAEGATLTGLANITVTATDNAGVSHVDYFLDGVLFSTVSNSPYSTTLDTTGLTNGNYVLRAEVTDTSSNSAFDEVNVIVSNESDSTPPTAAITEPEDGATIGNRVSIKVKANDNVAVTSVEIYINGELKAVLTSGGGKTKDNYKYAWNTRKLISGDYTIEAKAYDAKGNVGTSGEITVTKR